jgi:cell division protein FtsI (penicillin-binding protein 3)
MTTNAPIHADVSAPASHAPAPRPRAGVWRRAWKAMWRMRLDKSASRIKLVGFVFLCLYGAIAARLTQVGLKPDGPQGFKHTVAEMTSGSRPDIIDRNGELLATDLKVTSVFAEPNRLIDKDEAVELLSAVLPELDAKDLREKFSARRGFVWVKRGVTQKQREEVYRLGLPGVGFLTENKRVYPNGPIGAHILGSTNIDNNGIAGIEKYIDNQGLAALHGAGFNVASTDFKPIQLSLDMRATHALRDELVQGMAKYRAKAAAGAILDVNSGEVIALVSLPDFDPNNPAEALDPNHINRLAVGVFEMGSTFKAITTAMAIDAGKVNINTRIDARGALHFGRFTIKDYHAQNRAMSVNEVFQYSSNVGTARMALMVGVNGHKEFLRRMGQLDRLTTELPENAAPIVPKNWGELNTMTIAFGHGLAVAPLQAMMAVGALVNGGQMIKPTFLKREEEAARADAPRVVKAETSESLRYVMRNNAERGSATKASVPGYYIGGKTGTAEKVIGGRYSKNRLFTTFMAISPADKPKYLFLTIFDEPQGLPETHGYATAAWNGGVVTGKVIARVMPLLNQAPRLDLPTRPFPLLAKYGIGGGDKTGSIAPR